MQLGVAIGCAGVGVLFVEGSGVGVSVVSGCESDVVGSFLGPGASYVFCVSWPAPLIGGWAGVFLRVCCLDVVETSYEGHMVDALASRADEGRWSLR